MATVEVILRLEVPNAENLNHDHLVDEISENYINYPTLCHMREFFQWRMSLAKFESAGVVSMAKSARLVIARHEKWQAIGAISKLTSVKVDQGEPLTIP